ncbi:unnamed protein product [Auanema sp. JU1783]|nr:unnamed protein product [Auanema sp. JU1783]
MEIYQKFALLHKVNAACNLPVGNFEERMDVLDSIEKYYAPHVFESYSLMRRLLVPVIIAEFARPKLDPWTEMQNMLLQRKVLGCTVVALSTIVAAGLFWWTRGNL